MCVTYVSGQAIPPITVEEIVALGEKILITNVCVVRLANVVRPQSTTAVMV